MTNSLINRTTSARIPTQEGEFALVHYVEARTAKEHLALVMGDVAGGDDILVRVHSECFTGDVLGSQRCDCGEQLHTALALIARVGKGIIIYLRQEGRGIGLAQKLRAYNLQDQGYDTVDANLLLGHQADEREYSAAAAILQDLHVQSIRLLTNNPAKISDLSALGVTIMARVPLEVDPNHENALYLRTKAERMQHMLSLPSSTNGAAAPDPALQLWVNQHVAALHARAHAYHAATARPFVTLSYAQSLDGSIAARPGAPTALSSPAALRVTHALRAAHDAILVGIGTVLADDPQLTVRLAPGDNPQPVILDSHLRLPLSARLLHQPRPVWVAVTDPNPDQVKALAGHVNLLTLPTNGDRLVDLHALLNRLGSLGIRSLMVEGGARVISNFLTHGLANVAVITIAPAFLGGLRGFTGIEPRDASPTPALANVETIMADGDLLVWGDVTIRTPLSTSTQHSATLQPLA